MSRQQILREKKAETEDHISMNSYIENRQEKIFFTNTKTEKVDYSYRDEIKMEKYINKIINIEFEKIPTENKEKILSSDYYDGKDYSFPDNWRHDIISSEYISKDRSYIIITHKEYAIKKLDISKFIRLTIDSIDWFGYFQFVLNYINDKIIPFVKLKYNTENTINILLLYRFKNKQSYYGAQNVETDDIRDLIKNDVKIPTYIDGFVILELDESVNYKESLETYPPRVLIKKSVDIGSLKNISNYFKNIEYI